MGKMFRDMVGVQPGGDLSFSYFSDKINPENQLSSLKLEVILVKMPSSYGMNDVLDMKEVEFIETFNTLFMKSVVNRAQRLPLEVNGASFIISIADLELLSVGIKEIEEKAYKHMGQIVKETQIRFHVAKGYSKNLKIRSDHMEEKSIFRQGFNFEDMGVGGLDKEFSNIFRVAFSSRRYPQSHLDKYGIRHVKGILLYGPPGTGKTLIARQLSKSLYANEPKLVSGPEIFDKYVGGSEQKVRDLFKDAEKDEKALGDESGLHIIIFDEIEAICKTRGTASGSTGVNDSVVNQLLAKMDGVERLNNVLIIGMTNRLDMIDEAILRPGRMELKVEIGLPDEKGRLQIVKIHTKKMVQNKILEDDVDLEEIARMTKNFTGAEIESLVTRASTFALNRGVDIKNLNAKLNYDQKVSMRDFEASFEEIKPQFGTDDYTLGNNIQFGIINYGPSFEKLQSRLSSLVDQVHYFIL